MVLQSIIIVGTAAVNGWLTGGFVVRHRLPAFFTAFSIIVMFAIIVPFFRGVLLVTSVSRHMLAFFFAGCISVLLSRALGLFIDIFVEATFTVDQLILCTCFTLASIALEPLLVGGAVCYGLGLVAAAIWPSHAYVLLLASMASSGIWVYSIWNTMSENLGLKKSSHSS